MTLYDELYFEINASGTKTEINKFVKFLKSGELDDFFAVDDDYINYSDRYYYSSDENDTVEIVFSNDDLGIEISEFDVYEFLDVLCKAGRRLDLRGHLFDIDDEEFRFESPLGDDYYRDASKIVLFNDELDEAASEEDNDEDSDEE